MKPPRISTRGVPFEHPELHDFVVDLELGNRLRKGAVECIVPKHIRRNRPGVRRIEVEAIGVECLLVCRPMPPCLNTLRVGCRLLPAERITIYATARELDGVVQTRDGRCGPPREKRCPGPKAIVENTHA